MKNEQRLMNHKGNGDQQRMDKYQSKPLGSSAAAVVNFHNTVVPSFVVHCELCHRVVVSLCLCDAPPINLTASRLAH